MNYFASEFRRKNTKSCSFCKQVDEEYTHKAVLKPPQNLRLQRSPHLKGLVDALRAINRVSTLNTVSALNTVTVNLQPRYPHQSDPLLRT